MPKFARRTISAVALGLACAFAGAAPFTPSTDNEVVERLPATAQGIRVAGDPEATIRTIAVSGGSGDSLFDQVRASGVDAFLTADLRHHPASEARAHSPLALLDAAHWATEWPWCELAAAQLDEISDRNGWGLRVHVSATVTDPWTAHAASTTITSEALGAPN